MAKPVFLVGSTSRHLQSAALVLTLTVLVGFWCLFAYYRHTARAFIRARASASHIYLTNGTRLPLDRFVSLEDAWDPIARSDAREARRTLLIVSSDSCPGSNALTEHWAELIRILPLRPSDEVVFLSQGNTIPNLLKSAVRSKGIGYRILAPVQIDGLIVSTGIFATPYTIALDAEGRARLILKKLESSQSELLRAFFAS